MKFVIYHTITHQHKNLSLSDSLPPPPLTYTTLNTYLPTTTATYQIHASYTFISHIHLTHMHIQEEEKTKKDTKILYEGWALHLRRRRRKVVMRNVRINQITTVVYNSQSYKHWCHVIWNFLTARRDGISTWTFRDRYVFREKNVDNSSSSLIDTAEICQDSGSSWCDKA